MAKIVVIPGDGIGEEITTAAVLVLKKVAEKCNLKLTFETHHAGGTAYDLYGTPLPQSTIDAMLFAEQGTDGQPNSEMTAIPFLVPVIRGYRFCQLFF